MADNILVKSEMLKLRDLSIQYLRDFFQPDLKALISVSGGVDSTTVTYLLAESLGPARVVAFHFPNSHNNRDTANFNQITSLLGVENYSPMICETIESALDTLPGFADLNPAKRFRAQIPLTYLMREGLVRAYGTLEEGKTRLVGALDRAEYFTGNYPKYSCTGDIAPIMGMYRQQVRGLAALLGVPETIVYQPAETDSDPECEAPVKWFKKGEIAQDFLLFLICEEKMSDEQILEFGRESEISFDTRELAKARELIMNSKHKRVQHIPYPDVTLLGINRHNLAEAYLAGEMNYF
jgi:NH3-dependent NAD+ synthetase